MYYYRLRTKNNNSYKEIMIPLKVDMSLSTIQQHNQAEKRALKVHQQRKNLLNGVIDKTYFEWINEDKVSKVRTITLKNAIDYYMDYKTTENASKETIRGYTIILGRLLDCLGKNKNFESISHKDVLRFRKYVNKKNSEYFTYNSIRYFKYLVDFIYTEKVKDWNLNLNNKPNIKLPPKPDKEPMYFSEPVLEKILQCDFNEFVGFKKTRDDANYLKQVIKFYVETGCRLKEPFYANIIPLNKNYLMKIPMEETKRKQTFREFIINQEQKDFLIDFQKKAKDKKYHIVKFNDRSKISKGFKQAVKKVLGDESNLRFHNLRDTFAVRKYFETGDIHLVSRLLGHTNTNTTDGYTKFHISQLETDFPSVKKSGFFPKI
tara:strand:+ start:37215 stop:38342 length:1128 start_codon:yes stop_codon:yes gene_type:complete